MPSMVIRWHNSAAWLLPLSILGLSNGSYAAPASQPGMQTGKYWVSASTGPIKTTGFKRIKRIPRNIQQRIKKTSPNPKVQPPTPGNMPVEAPPMPQAPMPQPMPPQPTRTEKFFNSAAKIMTTKWGDNIFVWLPAIATDPNTGPTFGLMPVLVLADPSTHHIRHLVAPSYTGNELFGQTVTARYYFYPDETSQLYTIGSYSQHTNRELKIRYENASAQDGVLYLRGEAYYNVDGSQRFYGLGPATNSGDESGYTAKDTVVRGVVGFNFANAWRISGGARYRRFSTESNIIPNTTDLSVKYPTVPGVGGSQKTVAPEVRLFWDTRDYPITPSKGSSGEAWFELPSPVWDSNADFVKYGFSGKRFFPWENRKQVTVVNGLYEWANGPNIPFYEMPSLGGEKSLRGFGEGRFTDRGRLLFNLEHRITVASQELMGIQTNFEVAPFFDLGSVFPTLPQVERKYFYPVYGCGFRAAVKPNVVGNIEVGVGREGPAVFVGPAGIPMPDRTYRAIARHLLKQRAGISKKSAQRRFEFLQHTQVGGLQANFYPLKCRLTARIPFIEKVIPVPLAGDDFAFVLPVFTGLLRFIAIRDLSPGPVIIGVVLQPHRHQTFKFFDEIIAL
jgi:hypothetical protein